MAQSELSRNKDNDLKNCKEKWSSFVLLSFIFDCILLSFIQFEIRSSRHREKTATIDIHKKSTNILDIP